jgi:hypothetical protein
MAITKDAGRQYPLVAQVTFTGGTDVAATDTYEAIDLPPGARILNGSFYTPGGFTGNGTIAIQHGTNILIAAADYDAETNAVFDLTTDDSAYAQLTAADTIDVVLAVAALTDGTGTITVTYLIDGKADEVNP